MKIVIDMQGAQTNFSGHRGVGRYTRELARGLVHQGSAHEITLVVNGAFPTSVSEIRAQFGKLMPQARIKVWHQPLHVAASQQPSNDVIKAAQLIREAFILSLNPDVVFSTNLQEGLIDDACTSVKLLDSTCFHISTLHDVVPLFQKDRYLADQAVSSWYYEKLEFARISDLILTVSESSKRDIVEQLGVDGNKVLVVYNAVDSNLFRVISPCAKTKADLFSRLGIEGRFILYSGGNDLHKNIDLLYSAYAELPEEIRSTVQLVLVGRELKESEDSERKKLRARGIDSQNKSCVLYAGYLSDHELVMLMNLTSLFVFPSFNEGFGLPPLEAMACGAPVITSNAASLPEVTGWEEAMFDPHSVPALGALMNKALTDQIFADKLKSNGKARAKSFSWEGSAATLLGALERFEVVKAGSTKQRISGSSVADMIVNAKLDLTEDQVAKVAESVAESFDNDTDGTVYIDVSSIILDDARSGIQRVVRALCRALISSKDSKFVPVYTSVQEREHYIAGKFIAECLEIQFDGNNQRWVDLRPGDVLIYLDLHPSVAIKHKARNAYLRRKGLLVLHVVYDLIPLSNPEFFWEELCAEFKEWMDAVSYSCGAICISDAVAGDVRQWMVENAPDRLENFRIASFHLGSDIENSVPTKGLPADLIEIVKSLRSRPTFLMVGTIEPRKGYKQALRAFDCLWDRDWDLNLVMVGRKGWKVDELCQDVRTHREHGDRLHWFEGCSDELLSLLYECASCVLVASEAEGYGLPLVEAARHSKPIIARDIPVFREVAGDSAFFFSADHGRELADELEKWIELCGEDRIPRPMNMKLLTWQQSAAEFRNCVNDCASNYFGSATHY